jgi:quercetin dioxygenase-like cupin family protein
MSIMDQALRSAALAEAARVEAPWGSLNWLAGGAIGNARGLTLGRVVIKAGQCNPRHRHPGCEEILHLLTGRLRHTLGDASCEMGPGDTITIPVGVFHNAINVGRGDAEMIVVFDSQHRDFELEEAGRGSA